MQDGLLTGIRVRRPKSVLSVAVFSQPVNRTAFGSDLQHPEKQAKYFSPTMMWFAMPSPSKARLASEESAT
jgi:hypothetical protein